MQNSCLGFVASELNASDGEWERDSRGRFSLESPALQKKVLAAQNYSTVTMPSNDLYESCLCSSGTVLASSRQKRIVFTVVDGKHNAIEGALLSILKENDTPIGIADKTTDSTGKVEVDVEESVKKFRVRVRKAGAIEAETFDADQTSEQTLTVEALNQMPAGDRP
jgi:hypothetical protein